MTNREIETSQDYGNVSFEQLNLNPEDFYDRMDRLINPRPLAPEVVLKELFLALHEQLLVRVGSVEMAENLNGNIPALLFRCRQELLSFRPPVSGKITLRPTAICAC